MAEAIKIDEYTWRFEDGFVRFFLLVGENKAALIDSGVECTNAAEVVKAYTDKPVILVNTHSDGDHTAGTASFDEIYIHTSDYEGGKLAEKYPNTSLVEIKDGDIIDLGNRQLEIVHIPGHTSGSIAILDKANRVLYSGDSVQNGNIFMFGENRVPDKFENSLDKLIALQNDYDKIYASHDQFELPKDYVQKVKDVWLKVKDGQIPFEEIDFFGNKIKSYTTDVCGFYMD